MSKSAARDGCTLTIRIIGVEPEGAADAAASLHSGALQSLDADPITMAEGVKSKSIGDRNFDVIVAAGLVRDIVTIYRNYHSTTKVLVASVRHPIHVLDAAKIGADIATMPFAVMEKLALHPLTDLGLARFLKDWEKVPKG